MYKITNGSQKLTTKEKKTHLLQLTQQESSSEDDNHPDVRWFNQQQRWYQPWEIPQGLGMTGEAAMRNDWGFPYVMGVPQ